MTGGSYTALTPPAVGEFIERQWGLDVRDSCILRFASATARDSALTGLAAADEGLMVYLQDVNALTVYNGTAWKYLYTEPICHLTQTVAQSMPNATPTAVTFDTEVADTLGWHSTSSNTDRITPNVTGWYAVQGKITFASAGASGRVIYVYLNGAVVNGSGFYTTLGATGVQSVVTPTTHIYMNGTTDYVTCVGTQNSGGAVNTMVGVGELSSFSARLVRAEA